MGLVTGAQPGMVVISGVLRAGSGPKWQKVTEGMSETTLEETSADRMKAAEERALYESVQVLMWKEATHLASTEPQRCRSNKYAPSKTAWNCQMRSQKERQCQGR
jgi:hypothetical protein